MAIRRRGRRTVRVRPGFGPRKRGGGFPRWIGGVGIGLIVLAVIVVVALLLRNDGLPSAVTPLPVAATVTATVQATDARLPAATPTLATRPCTVVRDSLAYREPDESSVGQSLAGGKTVHVIDTIEAGGRTWYRVLLPGYDDVRYVLVEAVECK